MRSRYPRSCIGEDMPQAQWMEEKPKDWAGGIHTMMGVVRKNPQTAYVGLQKAFQQEWALVQHATKGIGEDFWTADKYLQEDFLLDLFLGAAIYRSTCLTGKSWYRQSSMQGLQSWIRP